MGPVAAGPGGLYTEVVILLAALAHAVCPEAPRFVDQDDQVVVLGQNLKFIVTGGQRGQRSDALAEWLGGEGAAVDLLLLSEARLTASLEESLVGWCLYTPDGSRDGYVWAPIHAGRPPGGLALGVRSRVDGVERTVSRSAGRAFRARPTTFAEGVIGRLGAYLKGWAEVTVDGTRLVWSHMQASYARRPDRGAGGPGRGRSGQVDELASDLVGPGATLLTGDLNLLDRHEVADLPEAARLARAVDSASVARLEAKSGIRLQRPSGGTFWGSLWHDRPASGWDVGAPYDRVGVNAAFERRHPGSSVERVVIRRGPLRVSDHDGLRIVIPYRRHP